MPVTQDALLTLMKQLYATTSDQSVKDTIGLFIIKNYPNDPALTDARLFAYWQALGRTEEFVENHQWVFHAIRLRWGRATAGQKTAVENELNDIANDANAADALKDRVNAILAELNPPPAFDPEATFGSISTTNDLTPQVLESLETHWGEIPAE